MRLALLGVIGFTLAHAQSDVARIVGTISDASGAVIPGANITVKNEKTGQTRQVKANEQGYFVALQLQPSTYELTVEATGMATARVTGVAIQVGQDRTPQSQPATRHANHGNQRIRRGTGYHRRQLGGHRRQRQLA